MYKKVSYNAGLMWREAGQQLDTFGCMLQGNLAYKQKLNRHRRFMPLFDKIPAATSTAFVAPDASLIGEVTVGRHSSVWYGAVLKGDLNNISVGEMSSLGDRCIITSSHGYLAAPDKRLWGRFPTIIGNRCVVEPGALLHACTLEDECVIGSGAMVFEGAIVGRNSIVGAGSVVAQGSHIPAGEMWAGHPAKFQRKLTDEEIAAIPQIASLQCELAMQHEEAHVQATRPEPQNEKQQAEDEHEKATEKDPTDNHISSGNEHTSKVPH